MTSVRALQHRRQEDLAADGLRPGEHLYAVGDGGELTEVELPEPEWWRLPQRGLSDTHLVAWLFARAMNNSALWNLIMRRAAEVYDLLCCLGFEYAEPDGLRLGWRSRPTDWRPYAGLSCAGGDLRANPPIGPPAAVVAAFGVPVIDP
jgi:hypothetical protein